VAPSVQRSKVCLTPTTGVPCSNADKARNPLKLAGMPQTTGSISAVSGPKFTILCGHLEEILLLNNLFPIVDTCQLRRYSPTKLCDGAQMAIFGDFFASCICSEPCAARFRPASEIRSKVTPYEEVWQTSNLRRLRLGEERKKEESKKKSQGKNIMVCPIP